MSFGKEGAGVRRGGTNCPVTVALRRRRRQLLITGPRDLRAAAGFSDRSSSRPRRRRRLPPDPGRSVVGNADLTDV